MASALAAAQKAILARIVASPPAGLAGIQYPNTKFTPPSVTASPALWAKVDLLWGEAALATMGAVGSGAARNTAVGVIKISVFGPADKGEAAVLGKCDLFRDLFNRQAFSGVRCGVASGPAPVTPEGAWLQRTVTVSFSYDELQ